MFNDLYGVYTVFKDELRKKKNKVGRDKESTYSDVKCYFVHFDSISSHDHEEDYILFRKSVSEARGLFMHVHKLPTIEKYMARLASMYFFFYCSCRT